MYAHSAASVHARLESWSSGVTKHMVSPSAHGNRISPTSLFALPSHHYWHCKLQAFSHVLCTRCLRGTVWQDSNPAGKALRCEMQLTAAAQNSILQTTCCYCFWNKAGSREVSPKLSAFSKTFLKNKKQNTHTETGPSEVENVRLQSFHEIIVL